MKNSNDHSDILFSDLDLKKEILNSLEKIGYERPSQIQALAIPHILNGEDIIGQAQTGTGKTAAFALPILSNLQLGNKGPQVLVLTPTRELAIQVAEAFQKYASHLKKFHVLPVYGGASMEFQIRQLKRQMNVVVGTPGRIMDHMRRGTLKLNNLECIVLDEADEMLRMGFAEDVDWILDQAPEQRQIALFSATMPKPIRKIANKYLKDPQEITVETKTSTADTINQRYYIAKGLKKLDVLTRVLETENCEGMLVFVRTKNATRDIADRLSARGYNCEALSGDVAQKSRERIVEKLKSGQIDIVVATDVAARGLDVDRISHVVNFDIPQDTESYVHRIGRTGRAGRTGEAILFVTTREKHLLKMIEKSTKQKIQEAFPPTFKEVSQKRKEQFKLQIQNLLETENLQEQRQALQDYQSEWDMSLSEISVALLKLVQTDNPLFAESVKSEKPLPDEGFKEKRRQGKGNRSRFSRDSKKPRGRGGKFDSRRSRSKGRGGKKRRSR